MEIQKENISFWIIKNKNKTNIYNIFIYVRTLPLQNLFVMPKKFAGENSKAVAAKARKAAAQEEQAQKKQKQIEDEYWKDDDKNAAKKQARKVK